MSPLALTNEIGRMVTRDKPRKTSSAQDARTTTMPHWVFWPVGQTPGVLLYSYLILIQLTGFPYSCKDLYFPLVMQYWLLFLRCYKIYGK